MFEKYTEDARRVIFFARFEASKFGSPTIESEHLLLGLLRERRDIFHRSLDRSKSVEEIRAAIVQSSPPRPAVSTSVDMPLSEECTRILSFSAEESERLAHSHIGSEHLLLGTLREQNCFASRLLREHGLQLDQVRSQIAAGPQPAISTVRGRGPEAIFHTPPATVMHLVATHLQQLEERLLDPAVRKDAAQLDALLSDDFREFGSSGRSFTKADIIALLRDEASDAVSLSLSDFTLQLLSPDVALATYTSARTDRITGETIRALRSSLWSQENGRWQMRFHQGTRIPTK